MLDNVLRKKSAQNRTRTCTPSGTRTWNVRVYQFRHLGIYHYKPIRNALFCSTCWAENGTRTRDPNLGKVVLYQLSYFRLFFLFWKASLSIAHATVMLFSELPTPFSRLFKKNFNFWLKSDLKDSYTLLYISSVSASLWCPGMTTWWLPIGSVRKLQVLFRLQN